MAITYSAPNGTIITSAIVTETLGSQSGAGSDGVILATAAITPSTHTGYGGNVGDNSEGWGPGDVYVGRLIAVRVGASDEEIKICTDVTDLGATIELTVHEDWTVAPVSSDILHVAYTGDDVNNGGAGGGVSFGNKTASWDFSNKFTVGNGTDFAFWMLGPAESMEINDSTGATDPDLEIKNNGMMASGYLFAGESVNGGYVSTEQNADGEEIWNVESGGYLRLHDTDWKVNLNDLKLDFAAGGDVVVRGTKNFQFTYDCNLLAGNFTQSKWVAGLAGAHAFVRIAEETTIESWNLVGAAGFHTEDADTSTETLTVRDVVFIDTAPLVTINSNKTWNVVNPVWTVDLSSFNDINFLTATVNEVNEKYSIDAVVQEPDGTKLQNALAIIYEDTQLADLVQEIVTDAAGEAAGSWIYRTIVDAESGPAAAEDTDIDTVSDVGGSLNGTCWLLDQPSGGYYVWYYDGITPSDPAPAGRTGIQVTYTQGDSADTIASLTAVAIDAVTGFTAIFLTTTTTTTP